MVLEEEDPVGAEQRRILEDIKKRNTASLLFDEEIYPPLSSGRLIIIGTVPCICSFFQIIYCN
jgi:hypothetical protein